jgi:hypothetical protein
LGTTPIGAPIVGWVGETLGARWALWMGGGLTLLGAVLAIALLAHLKGGLPSVLTPYRGAGSLFPRVWDDQAVARARR